MDNISTLETDTAIAEKVTGILQNGSEFEKKLLAEQLCNFSPEMAIKNFEDSKNYMNNSIDTLNCIRNHNYENFDEPVYEVWRKKYTDVIYNSDYISKLFKDLKNGIKRLEQEGKIKVPENFYKTELFKDPEGYGTKLINDICPYADFYYKLVQDVTNQVNDIDDSNCEDILNTIAAKEKWGEPEVELIQRAYEAYVEELRFSEDDFCEMLGASRNKLEKILDSSYNQLLDSDIDYIISELSKPNPHSDWIGYIHADFDSKCETHYNEFCEKFKFNPWPVEWDHWSHEVISEAIKVYVNCNRTLNEFANDLGICVEDLEMDTDFIDFALEYDIIRDEDDFCLDMSDEDLLYIILDKCDQIYTTPFFNEDN